jgi:hypothetical protein
LTGGKNVKSFFESKDKEPIEIQCGEEVELTNEKGKAYTE